MTEAAAVYPPLDQRPLKNTICLFDVDETLTPARRAVSPQMLQILSRLRHKCAIGSVGGSDFAKQQEQLGTPALPVIALFDFCFAENGLTAYRMGVPLASQSFVGWLGEERYKELVNFCLRWLSECDIPVKRGTFVEFRNGMVNISPIGRNASLDERIAFNIYDKEHKVREKFVAALREKFSHFGLTFSIGGQISFDAFPTGWDKTYCLKHVAAEKNISGVDYTTVHFFGDNTQKGGNDYEIAEDPRTVGHAVKNPEDTMRQLEELFGV
ncbi:Phosphomannomutase [Toensbergia leucococca]|nr:Phosphomannomutase [Toensbergia leucococca]